MPVTFPPIDSDVLAGLRAGDERALERLFRERFVALVEDARAQLDDPAAARRAIEATFFYVWGERASFGTPDELESFLQRAARETAAREKSRLASLHRFDSHEGGHARKRATPAPAPSLDEAWAHLAARLHAPPPDHDAAVRASAEHSRHAAAEHMAAVEKRQVPVGLLAIGAVLVLIMLAAYWWVDRAGEDLRITRALASEDVRVLNSGRAQQAVITLDDGSKVTLGAESRLTVPPGFGEEFRAVKLDGTASFTAASGQETPFQVRAHNAAIKATGTVFDVRAYETDSAVIVRVRQGEVTVRVADTSRTLAAGRALAVANDGSMREPSAQAVGEALGWTEGRLVIADRPLREVLPQMVRWHGLQIHVPDSSLLDRRVTMNAALASSREAIEALEQSAGVKFGYAGQVMILRDTAAMQPKARKPSRAR